MTQEFHLSVTPFGGDTYLVRTEQVETGVPLAEEQVVWPVDTWLQQARQLMNDPVLELLQGVTAGGVGDLLADPKSSNSVSSVSSASGLVTLGRQLYASLFQGMVRDSWMAAQSIAQNRREVLRLRLGLQGNRLHQLPWEVLHGEDRPLTTGTDVTFSRYQSERGVSTFASDRWKVQPHQPLRILMVLSAPDDQEQLALQQEFHHLQMELQQNQEPRSSTSSAAAPEIQITLLNQPGREQLTQALEQGNYQVFHYAGHSNFGTSGGNLYLVNPRTGLTEMLSGEDLAGLLVNNGIYMAVLNSCRGAHTATTDMPHDGGDQTLAQALIRRGIPGVLAMAERIPDEVALTLSRLLYRNLKQGYPIDLSLNRTRQGLISAYGSHQLYWALPVLYLHWKFDGYVTASDRDLMLHLNAPLRSPPYDEEPAALPGLPLNQTPGDSNGLEEALQAEPSPLRMEESFQDPASAALLDDVWATEESADLPWLDEEGEPDLGSWVDDLEYEDEQSYDEDAAIVADLIQQLSQADEPDQDDTSPSHKENGVLPTLDRATLANASPKGTDPVQTSSILIPNPGASSTSSSFLTPNPLVSGASAAPTNVSSGSGVSGTGTIPPPGGTIQPGSSAAKPQRLSFWPDAWSDRFRNRRWVWAGLISLGVVGVAAVTLLGVRTAWTPRSESDPTPASLFDNIQNLPTEPPIGVDPETDLEQLATADVTQIALAAFENRDLDEIQQAMTVLMNRGALSQAQAVLSQVPADLEGHPTVNFLRGRLVWHRVQTGDPDYGIPDARRFWAAAVRDQPDEPLYKIALGFAYYHEARSTEAIDTFLQALTVLESQSTTRNQQASSASPEPTDEGTAVLTTDETALTAYAGLALASVQAAEKQTDATTRQTLLSRANKFYQTVITHNPDAFQIRSLAQNWLWTEAAIANWQAIPEKVNPPAQP